jgi:hypothetical protein
MWNFLHYFFQRANFFMNAAPNLTANDIFKGIVLKQRKVAREKLAWEKTVRERQVKVERNTMIIQAAKGRGCHETYRGQLDRPPHLVPTFQCSQDEEGREASFDHDYRQQRIH